MTGANQLYTSALHMCMCVHTCTHTHAGNTNSKPRQTEIWWKPGVHSGHPQNLLLAWGWGDPEDSECDKSPNVNHLSYPSLKGQPLPHSAPCGLYWLLWRKPSEKIIFSFFHQSWRSLVGLAAFCLDISKRQGPCGFSQPVNVSCLLALGATSWPIGKVCPGGDWCIREALRFWGLANTAYKDASFFKTNNHTAFPIRILACAAVGWTLSLFLGVWCEVWFSELWIWGFPYLGC